MAATKPKKKKPLTRSQKIILALLTLITLVVVGTALLSIHGCAKPQTPVQVNGWYMHYNIPIDTNLKN